jgi:hypothetical protein
MISLRVILLSLLCLTLLATSASAECAWLLWTRGISPIEDWDITSAHPNLQECTADLNAFGQTYQRNGYTVTGLIPGARSATYEKGDSKGYLHCLPDTVDPRGPKGK